MYKLTAIVNGVTILNLDTEIESIAKDLHERVLKGGSELTGKDFVVLLQRDAIVLNKLSREKGVLKTEKLIDQKLEKNEKKGFFVSLFAS